MGGGVARHYTNRRTTDSLGFTEAALPVQVRRSSAGLSLAGNTIECLTITNHASPSTGTDNAVKGTDNAVKGTDNASKGTDNAIKGTGNAIKGTDNAIKGTDNAV